MSRSPYDREILRLAVPALGALAAEPLYVLADTAIVGHLGTPQLAALALAGTILNGLLTVFNFLTYGTTAMVARLHGAREEQRAGQVAAQALWLAAGIGLVLGLILLAFAGPLTALIGGGHDHVARLAARYLRLSAPSAVFVLVSLAGQGYMRGVSSLKAPLAIVLVANAANVVLELVMVYGLDMGLDGSAVGTVIAQAGMGAAFAIALLRAGGPDVDRRPRRTDITALARVGADLVVRTGSLIAAFVVTNAVVARVGAAALGAHQIAYQLFLFLALVLDSIAIAGQILVGRKLGADDAGGAVDAARRMILWSVVIGAACGALLLAGIGLIPRAFSSDHAVLHQAHVLWPLFAAVLPIGAAVFALDGILIGAGDTRYIAGAMAFSAFGCFLPVALMTQIFGWGVAGAWSALIALMVARLATMGWRFRGRRWVTLGAVARAPSAA